MDTLVDDGEPWIGLHRGIGGVHRRVLRHRHWIGRKAWPVVAFAALAASVGLFLSTWSRPAPQAGQVVQIPGVVVNRQPAPTPVGGSGPRANGSGGSVGAADRFSPPPKLGSVGSKLGASPSASAHPSPASSAVVPLASLIPALQSSAPPCPMPTRRNGKPKVRPSAAAD